MWDQIHAQQEPALPPGAQLSILGMDSALMRTVLRGLTAIANCPTGIANRSTAIANCPTAIAN
jgi:hypothetical protein